MSDTDELRRLVRQLSRDETAEDEWSQLDCIVGDWIERHRRRTEVVTAKVGAGSSAADSSDEAV